jgi:hypothetical protein
VTPCFWRCLNGLLDAQTRLLTTGMAGIIEI